MSHNNEMHFIFYFFAFQNVVWSAHRYVLLESDPQYTQLAMVQVAIAAVPPADRGDRTRGTQQ